MNKITGSYIFNTLGGKKEYDMNGGIYVEYGEGFFYPKDFMTNEWVYHYDNYSSPRLYKTVSDLDEFERLYL